jgi:hypothetical protein
MKFKNDLDRAENFLRELKYLTEKYQIAISVDSTYETPIIFSIGGEHDIYYEFDFAQDIGEYHIIAEVDRDYKDVSADIIGVSGISNGMNKLTENILGKTATESMINKKKE